MALPLFSFQFGETVPKLGVVTSPNETDAGSNARHDWPGRSNRACMDRPAGAGPGGRDEVAGHGGTGRGGGCPRVARGQRRRVPDGCLFGRNPWVDGGRGQENAGWAAASSGPGADRGALPEPTPLPALWRAAPAQGHPSPTADVVVWRRGGSCPSFRLERRGHAFCRYADDCNVYVRSKRAGERVMALLRRLYGRLHLTVNEAKSAVASVFGRKFLGYAFWRGPGAAVKRAVADKAIKAFKDGIRELTPRVCPATIKYAPHPDCRATPCHGTQPPGGRGTAPHLHAGVEGLLPVGANTRGLAKAGRMDTPPAAGHPTQAVAARRNDLAGVDGARSQACGRQSSGGKCSVLVAQQRDAPQLRPHDPMGRPVGSAQARVTSIPRTARCGPAGRVVWQGRGRNDHPLCRLFGPDAGCVPAGRTVVISTALAEQAQIAIVF